MKIVEADLECIRLEEGLFEGEKVSRHINSYERNSKLRAKAISIHGTECMACGFNFEKVYGKRGSNFIEVHHIKPISTFDKEVKVNPKDDLIVLCSNCHRMVHRKKDDVLSLKKLKELLSGL
jgi:predicted HNH restriction endonuclease